MDCSCICLQPKTQILHIICIILEETRRQDDPKLVDLLSEAVSVVDRGLKKSSSDNWFYTVMAVLSVFTLYICSSYNFPYGLGLLRGVVLVILTLFFGFCIWHQAIINRIEVHGLKNARLDIENLLKSKQKQATQTNILSLSI